MLVNVSIMNFDEEYTSERKKNTHNKNQIWKLTKLVWRANFKNNENETTLNKLLVLNNNCHLVKIKSAPRTPPPLRD